MDNMCFCGKPFVGMCRIIALQQLTGNPSYVFDTSKLTNNPEINRQLIRDPNNFFIVDEGVHGLQGKQQIYNVKPSAPRMDDVLIPEYEMPPK